MKKLWMELVAASLLLSGVYAAELSFAPIFNDGAVLQCEMPVNIWGTANSGERVTVSFSGQEKSVVADASGKWMLQLDPMPASSEPRTLTCVSSIGNQKSTIGHVLVGEVWLASGQSNIALTLGGSDGGPEWLTRSLAGIRFIKIPQKTGLPVEREYTPAELAWKSFEPGQNAGISAVAFYFSEQILKATGRPVGILQSAAAGTPCEAWTPLWALDAYPELKHLADTIRKGVAAGRPKKECVAEVEANHQWYLATREWKKTKEGSAPINPGPVERGNPWYQEAPTVLYENMIAPLLPYTARGVIWYQGENNVGRSDEYRVLFPAMIKAWRTAANHPGWPFLFVQLPAYDHPSPDWVGVQDAQTSSRDAVPNTGMAVAVDLGEKDNIHPKNKQPVGERLARLALDQVYGQDVVSRGPAFQSLEPKDGKMRVVFQCSEEGLQTSDGKPEVPGFEVAGADGKYGPAQARIVAKDTVELWSDAVPVPASVRYAWHNWNEPPVTLQNSAGLPAEPFKK